MSSDFSKKLVYDDRLMVSDSVDYAVIKGGSQVTQATFAAISQSTSSVTFNINVPSEQTLIDRRVLWRATVQLRLTGIPANNAYLINYGANTALAPFPLHNLCSVMSATINNNTVSTNIQDVLPALLRCNDSRELAAYNGMTPTMFDTYQKYSDATNTSNNPLGSWSNTNDNDMIPRGAFNVVVAGNSIGDGATVKNVTIDFTVTEPLLLSPFIWANPQTNNQAFYGVQNLNFQFNLAPITGVIQRVIRSSVATTGGNALTAVALTKFEGNELLFNFITPPPSLLMPARNVVPYYEVPRYISSFSTTATGAQSVTPSTLQLNQVPDKLIIMVRKKLGAQTINDTDSCYPITGISINWNNSSGILSSATVQDLYRYSRDAGSNQNFQEFSGSAFKQVDGSGAGGSSQNGSTINTSGSFLMLDFGKAIQLSDDYYAPGSLGNFNLQIRVSYTNNTGTDVVESEVVIITLNSGVFVNERGSSSTYTGILTKQDVLDAAGQEPVSHASVKRLVGGGFLDSLKSVVGKVAPLAKIGLALAPHPAAKAASAALGALGYGKSGGRKHNKLM